MNTTVTGVPVGNLTPSQQNKFANTSAQGSAQNAVEAVGKIDFNRTLSAIVTPIHTALRAMAPEEVSVELGLGIKGEVGIFVASSEGNASVKITAKWKFGTPPQDPKKPA